ncbi:MAG TPA: hypothetical protein VNB94_03995 [Mycobacteriales bacterium]|nr:hypothetical protein [Mycobacteriales bacterium]
MKARVILTRGERSLVEAGVELTKSVLVPAARRHPGYRGYVALYDAERGFGMAVTLWEDEHAEQDSDDAMRESREQFAQAYGAEVTVEKYDVAVVDYVESPGWT